MKRRIGLIVIIMMLGLTGCKNKNEEVVDNALVDVQNQEVSDEDVEEAIRNREFEDAKNLTLNNKKCLNFLKFIGYPSNYNLDEYLNILIDKLNSDNFPHEIGIFLGYPLKDVVGFMGYGKYKFCKTRYWKVYGDESVSDAVYNKFISDRAKIKVLLENNSLSELRKVI